MKDNDKRSLARFVDRSYKQAFNVTAGVALLTAVLGVSSGKFADAFEKQAKHTDSDPKLLHVFQDARNAFYTASGIFSFASAVSFFCWGRSRKSARETTHDDDNNDTLDH